MECQDGRTGAGTAGVGDMSEMVERVALAILKSRSEGYGPHTQARAAIEAMREPTEAMARAPTALADWEDSCAEVVWDAMIDAALK